MALALSIHFYFEEENIVARRLKGNKDYPKKLNTNCVNSSCHSAHAGEMILCWNSGVDFHCSAKLNICSTRCNTSFTCI